MSLPPEESRRPQDTLVDSSDTNGAVNHQEAFEQKVRELRTLKVFCWNIWFGGREIDEALQKQAAVLNAEDADIVLLQECFGPVALRLGRQVGMSVAQQDIDCAVLSAAPMRRLTTSTAPFATAALVETRMGDVLAWSVHLASWDYGPYRHAELPESVDEVFSQPGELARTAQVEKILAETDRLVAQYGDLPVIIAGDFNVPSGLDWDGKHRPLADWPAPRLLMDAGFTDAFRAANPDPAVASGLTWSQIEPLETEPRDRIDFVFAKGLEVVAADHLGGAADDVDAPADPAFTEYGGVAQHIPNQRGNAFPSDHLAVRATLRPERSIFPNP